MACGWALKLEDQFVVVYSRSHLKYRIMELEWYILHGTYYMVMVGLLPQKEYFVL